MTLVRQNKSQLFSSLNSILKLSDSEEDIYRKLATENGYPNRSIRAGDLLKSFNVTCPSIMKSLMLEEQDCAILKWPGLCETQ